MNSKLTILAFLSLISVGSQAAETAFYTIEEVQSSSASVYGPWASGMAKDGTVVSLSSSNDAFSYFNVAPTSVDLAHRFRYEFPCEYQMSSTVCGSFWDGGAARALQWRYDTLSYVPQLSTIISGVTRGEVDGVVTKMGDSATDFVGYQVAQAATNSTYHQRTAFISLAGSLAMLNSTANANGSFSSAYDLLKIGDNTLVAGTANTSITGPDNAFGRCYNGNSYSEGEYRDCPGFNTQAAFWLLTPGASQAQATLGTAYYKPDNNVLQTSSVMGLAQLGDENIVAVGYSSTGDLGDSVDSGRNVAVTWNVTVNDSSITVSDPVKIPLPQSAPGEADEVLRHTWAVAANSQGYVIGNQKFSSVKSRNTPVEMFVYNINSNVTTLPLADTPHSGANSEAAALNSHNLVVGWRDERNESQPVYQGSPRLQEAFLYNINTGNTWRLNDLICGTDGTSNQCQQNGYYYYIVNATAINDAGVIAATAYRYASYDDWSKRNNPIVVSVRMAPSTSFETNYDVPASKVVTNGLPINDYGQSAGSGAVDWWVGLFLLPMLLWRRRTMSQSA